jgi:large subunit ribosomal protein L23
VNDNVLTFKADEKLSKPEIKQYLEKLYNINIEKVNTVRYMGVVKRNPVGAPMTTKNFKRVYVMTNHKIDPVLNGVICN